jgi:geranylgeranyl diphosphate synthase type I
MSVLAGDLAAAWAQRALLEVCLSADRVVLAAREFAAMQEEVIHGQVLDVAGVARDAREVEAMHALKTASYSVRGPVVMGARLRARPSRRSMRLRRSPGRLASPSSCATTSSACSGTRVQWENRRGPTF